MRREGTQLTGVACFVGLSVWLSATRFVSIGGVGVQQLAGLLLLTLGLLAACARSDARTAGAGIPIRIAGLGLTMVFAGLLFATVVAAVSARAVDWLQAIRDLRDLVMVGVSAILAVSLVRRAPSAVLAGLVGGGVAASITELSLRGEALYVLLFLPPFGGTRWQAGFLGPNEYGAFLSLLAVVSGAWALVSRGLLRWGLTSVSLLALWTLASTLSRGGILATVLGGVAAIAAALVDPRNRRAAAVAIGILGVSAAVGSGALARSPVLLEALGNRLRSGVLRAALGDRQDLGAAAIEIAAQSGGLGAGLGGFAGLNQSYGGSGTLSPHNELLKALSDGGVLAAAGVLLLLFALLVAGLRPGSARPVMLGLAVSLIVSDSLYSYLVRPGFAFVMVLGAAVVLVGSDGSTTQVQ